ncbi:MAG: hypothetical protein ACI802_003874, partial [Candidatus Paceibacteria bacterium]
MRSPIGRYLQTVTTRFAAICLLGLFVFTSATAISAPLPGKLKGVNISGGEYNGGKTNGRLYFQYIY